MNLFIDQSNYEVIKEPKYTLKIETKTTTEPRSVIGIETPLNTMSITLQDRKERNQNGSSKQSASAAPPLVKGKKLPNLSAWAQRILKFKDQIKMPPKGKNRKGFFFFITETTSVQKTFF